MLLFSQADIVAAKAGFQRADLMNYDSLYGKRSYFGEDYTAINLVRLARLIGTENNIVKVQTRKRSPRLQRTGRRQSVRKCVRDCKGSISPNRRKTTEPGDRPDDCGQLSAKFGEVADDRRQSAAGTDTAAIEGSGDLLAAECRAATRAAGSTATKGDEPCIASVRCTEK